MPYGPKGEWRTADPVAAAVHIGKLMVGEVREVYGRPEARPSTVGGKAILGKLTPAQRTEPARAVAKARRANREE